MIKQIHYLQRYRKGNGVLLKEMARIIGVDSGNLSRIEAGINTPNIHIIIAYHILLKVPIENLLKKHFPEITKNCIANATALKDEMLAQLTTPDIPPNVMRLDKLIDRLENIEKFYGK